MKYQEYTENGSAKGRSPAEIEADLAAIRSEMSATIQLLEEKFSPRAMLDQFFSRARGMGQGSSDFVSNLGATVRDNPVPVLLLATGVVSLLASERMGGRRMHAGAYDYDQSHTWQGGASRAESAKSKANEAKQRIGERVGKLGERASELRGRASERAGRAGERASELGGRAREMSERARERGAVARERVRGAAEHAIDRGSRTIEEQPLVIVGLGVALGAILGAGMPVSGRERRMLGPTGERVRERVERTAQQGAERAKTVAKEVAHTVDEQIGGGPAAHAESPAQPGQEESVRIEQTRAVSEEPRSPGRFPGGGAGFGEGEQR